MAYTKKTWVSGETPLSAENMNNIDLYKIEEYLMSKIAQNEKIIRCTFYITPT